MATEETYSAAWQQFLLAKRAMLAEYDRALAHAKTQTVVTHHGNVAEAAVRDWLGTFLPKRFGVTPGYVRSQGVPDVHHTSHFDVIVYDQLEAPTLWIEENRDKAEGGRARIIPAENVGAIIEVKAGFNRRSVSDATRKLQELEPLMVGVDDAAERYPSLGTFQRPPSWQCCSSNSEGMIAAISRRSTFFATSRSIERFMVR